ncbi:MAG: hypothetical protein VCF08_02430 [Alphaproteobacteria bacterium]
MRNNSCEQPFVAYDNFFDSATLAGGSWETWSVTNANSQIPAFAVGMPVRVARTAAPTKTYMQGEITAFTASTGSTTVNVSSSLGSGTHSDWTIVIGGHQTTASASPLAISDGGTGAATAGKALRTPAFSQRKVRPKKEPGSYSRASGTPRALLGVTKGRIDSPTALIALSRPFVAVASDQRQQIWQHYVAAVFFNQRRLPITPPTLHTSNAFVPGH